MVGSLLDNVGSDCSDEGFASFLNGTYVLPLVGIFQYFVEYSNENSGSEKLLRLQWGCDGFGPFFLNSAVLLVSYCGPVTQSCYRVVRFQFQTSIPVANQCFPMPGINGLVPGQSDSYSFAVNQADQSTGVTCGVSFGIFGFSDGNSSCDQLGPQRKGYEGTITIQPVW